MAGGRDPGADGATDHDKDRDRRATADATDATGASARLDEARERVRRLRAARAAQRTARSPEEQVTFVPQEMPHRLPPSRAVELPGRGTTWVLDQPAPEGVADPPTLLLLHGWTATAATNWFSVFDALSEHYRVVALDHRGHGRGIRTWRRFRLEDCADDVVALADELGIDRFVPVGYSMGGPIAQLTWKRHHDRVEGLVLCATARNFRGRPGERALFSMMAGLSVAARVTPGGLQRSMNARMLAARFADTAEGRWAASELGRNDPRMIVEAGQAIGRFSSAEWIGGVDVPTAVVVTEFDSVVPPHRQKRLAASIAGATTHIARGDHGIVVMRPKNFRQPLLDACESVTTRVRRRARATG